MQSEFPMPDERVNPLQPEMYLSYQEGVNAFAQNHREMGGATLRHLVNGTVRGGWVETRPHFECLQLTYENESARTVFETGKVQGSSHYRVGESAVLVYAIDGNLFAVDPIAGSVANINPNGEQPFSRCADFVYFQTRSGYLISGDGIGRQVITEGFESRYSRPADPHNEVPTSLMMADDWGRLVCVDPDRRRIRLSNHELDPDPTYSPLGFDETFDYYLSSRWFKVPDHIGKIVWVGFLPQLNSDTGTGPLLVLGEHGTRYYDVSVDRAQWKLQDISGTLMPDIGGLAHRAQVTRNDQFIFSDQYGRIRNLRNALRDQKTLTVKRFDRHVAPYYANEPTDLRRWRCAVEWDERILVTVQPESHWIDDDRFQVRHRGMVVWNGEVTEMSDEQDRDVWDGLWTGIYPATLDTGKFGNANENLCIALSVDQDGINRPYVIREDGAGRHDIAPSFGNSDKLAQKRIEMQIITRQFDFSGRDSDYSLLLKQLDRGAIRIGERYGKTDLTGYIQSDQEYHSRTWFEHKTDADHCLKFEKNECDECVLTAGRSHQDGKLRLPADVGDEVDPVNCELMRRFYKMALHIVAVGWIRLEEMIFTAEKKDESTKTNIECERGEARRNTGCNPPLWRYHAQTAKDIS